MQDHNTRVTENSVTHIEREAQSLVLTDFSDRSTWMMEFSVTLVFWSCVTLGFFNSVWWSADLSPGVHIGSMRNWLQRKLNHSVHFDGVF
jgi:hypothetical protein